MHLMFASLLLAAALDPAASFKAGDFDTAKQGYTAAIAANPKDAASLAGLARVELYENRLTDAHRDAQRALAIDPANDIAQRTMRTIRARQGTPGEFVIAQTATAVLPFVVSNPLPIVRMNFDGHPANVLIDTGAPAFVVSQAFAHAHHMTVTSEGQGTFAGGRHAQLSSTVIHRISMNGLDVHNVHASVVDLPPMGPGVSADAIVGTSFFAHFLTTIDYPRSRLVIAPASTIPAQPAVSEPMWYAGDHFLFAYARINGGAPQLLNVDTGGGGLGVQLTKAALDSAGIKPDIAHAETFTGGGGPTRAAHFTASVSFGGAVQTVPGLYFLDGDQYGIFPFTVTGTISHEFFKKYALTFDFSKMRILLR